MEADPTRFIRLIRELLEVGYLEDWKYNATMSGSPQGGIISPILSNIYLNKLDTYVEKTLLPMYTRGTARRKNPAYQICMRSTRKLKKEGNYGDAREVRRKAQQMPSYDPTDPNFRRLKYVRYADDWLIGFIGPKEEAEEIKRDLKTYLHEVLRLDLSEEKTLITHSRTEAAHFLSYQISTTQANSYRPKGGRYANGKVEMRLPLDILKKKCQKYLKHGNPIHRTELENDTVYTIIAHYQAQYRGFVEYYQLANNIRHCNRLKWRMEQSLTKTLAAKLKLTVNQVYEKYKTTLTVDDQTYPGLQVIIPREEKKPLIATWGGIPLVRKPRAILNDQPPLIWAGRSELEKRLLADTCELCGSTDRITIHHIRALKDLHPLGRSEKPDLIQVMSPRKRKTLVVCWPCHMDIQHGRPVRKSQAKKMVRPESRVQ